ncbi:2OG-Fe(II) oxygenase [Stutzerimonas tarimensis]|uniref:2OG-Fe(II) oxygenase n=1 Tax=Stutzerimonas tarimensis TaxID=1507735 RepID=A0ABV7T477_9GAMM
MSLQPIIEDLARCGWSLQERFVEQPLIDALAEECRQRESLGELEPAGVGRAAGLAVREGVRGDRIRWIEVGQSPACDRYLTHMEALRQELNRAFFLGLEEFECHFAFYPPGAFYKTHLDCFRDDDSRIVTVVLYLNTEWQSADGGCMRMHLRQGPALDVAPLAGNLVVFLSAEVPHEVLPTQRDRLSLTGWFRRRAARLL